MQTSDLLVEFLSEEIPARMQLQASQDLHKLFVGKLHEMQLAFEDVQVYVTPRRLALHVTMLQTKQLSLTIEKRGPRTDAPSMAIEGFLQSVGLTSIDALEKRLTDKGEFFFFNEHTEGSETKALLPELINAVIKQMVWPKSMRWGRNTVTWVRPLRNIMCVLGQEIVPGCVDLGCDTLHFNNTTVGHRFLSSGAIAINNPKDYVTALKNTCVLVDQNERRTHIQNEMQKVASGLGLSLLQDDELLNEVTGLVEWPVILVGSIDQKFMNLPREVLVTSLKVNQKYFLLQNQSNQLAPYYIVIANMDSKDNGQKIINGNTRVLNARLADAEFFYQQDSKNSLEQFLPKMKNVVFHVDLGSMADKIARLQALSEYLSTSLGYPARNAMRVALLCKTDLMTEMVGEFANLQGVMGYYYALLQNESRDVAQAIADHYKPKGPTDTLPRGTTASVVALADKIDVLVGMFSVGIKPTGSKDPFGLRRCALGVVRILELHYPMKLASIVEFAYQLHIPTINSQKVVPLSQVVEDVLNFVTDRAKVYWKDQGVDAAYMEAALKGKPLDDIGQERHDLQLLSEFMHQDVGAGFVVAFKRVANILHKEDSKQAMNLDSPVDPGKLESIYEQNLYHCVQSLVPQFQSGNSYQALQENAASITICLEEFFTHVIVNDPNDTLRLNRLRLLQSIKCLFEPIAHFEKIEK